MAKLTFDNELSSELEPLERNVRTFELSICLLYFL